MRPSHHTTSTRSRWWALAVLCTSALLAVVDETIVAVSLPAIQAELGFTNAGASWITGAYLVAFAGLMLLAGRSGDVVGRRRVFLVGLAVFTGASALCGAAWTPAALVAARFAQGSGGAAMTAVALGMIVGLFPDARDRARAIGVFAAVQAVGGTLGMLVGGLVTDALSWHWVFLLNVPLGVAAFALAVRLLPDDSGRDADVRLDVVGAILVTTGVATAVYTVSRLDRYGPTSAHTLGFAAVAAALLGGFAVRQTRAADPLLPPRLLVSRRLLGANAVLLLLVAAMFGFMFLTALTLQRALGFDARQAGLAMVPTSVVIAVLSTVVTPKLIGRVGDRRVLPLGLAVVVAGFVLLTRVPADADYATDLLPALILLGSGFGLAMPALMSSGTAEATPRDSGVVSGLFNTTQQFGGALGLAGLLAVAAARTDAAANGGESERLLDGYRLGFGVAAGLTLTALAAALLLGRRRSGTRADATPPESRAPDPRA